MKISRIDLVETQDFWELIKQLDQETEFMLLEPDERTFNFSKTAAQIASQNFIVGARSGDNDKKLVGYVACQLGQYRRIAHTGYVVIGILQDFQHQGIGQKLFDQLIDWAKAKDIKRLELTVMMNNPAAIALYQNNGFEIEGVRRQSMCVNSQYIDEFYMSRIFE